MRIDMAGVGMERVRMQRDVGMGECASLILVLVGM
jgi:hypothetical protein